MNIHLKVKKLTPTAKVPTQEHKGDLYDVYADEDVLIVEDESKLVSTGLAFDIPEGYQIRLYNRSGNPLKYGLILSNGLGVIDTAYKGALKGQFFCKKGTYKIHKGDKIAQMEIVPINTITFEEVNKLSDSDRGAHGFGSTGR